MRKLLALGICALVGLLLPAAAAADHHFMKIREVYVDPADPSKVFVELQMYFAGQNLVSDSQVAVYDGLGMPILEAVFPADVANGESQRSILVSSFPAPFGVAADLEVAATGPADPAAGGACFMAKPASGLGVIDCVGWGGYAGPEFGAGMIPAAPAFAAGQSLHRDITPGCETLLEALDDSDDSATDFFLAAPSPRNNLTPPTEAPCTGNGGDGDESAPPVDILGGRKLRLSRKGVAKLRLLCGADEASPPCSGTVVLKTARKVPTKPSGKGRKKKLALAKAGFSLQPDRTKKARLKLSRKHLKLVRRLKAARKVAATVRARDAVGNRSRTKRKLTLVPR